MSDRPHDRSAEIFVNQHLETVWRYLRMHGASPHEADDLAQEAFVTAIQKGAMHLDPPAAQVFLRRAARFAFLHLLRSRRRDPVIADAPALADAVDELWDRDANQDGGVQLVQRLEECIQKLEGRPRQAIRLSYGIGQEGVPSRNAIAKTMGMRPNGLKTLLQRTRQLLRACMERAPK